MYHSSIRRKHCTDWIPPLGSFSRLEKARSGMSLVNGAFEEKEGKLVVPLDRELFLQLVLDDKELTVEFKEKLAVYFAGSKEDEESDRVERKREAPWRANFWSPTS